MKKFFEYLLILMSISFLLIGGYLVWGSLEEEVPIPQKDFKVAPTIDTDRPTTAMIDGKLITPENMGKNRLFIPEMKTYSRVVTSKGTKKSRYKGFSTLKVPNDPRKTARYGYGAPMVGGPHGTTLLASHVSYHGKWGTLRKLYKLEAGAYIFTSDGKGNVQAWVMTEMRTTHHKKFPQELWSNDGVRQLAIVTCGGKRLDSGSYRYNVIAIASPIIMP